jgi:hypothetical protein
MRNIRNALSILSALLLMAGYLGSQWAYMHGNASVWAARMDEQPIRSLAALLLITALALAFYRDAETEKQ